MSQRDAVLLIPLCNYDQIMACEDQISDAKVLNPQTFEFQTMTTPEGSTRFKHICDVAVPGSCPRLQCFRESTDEQKEKGIESKYLPCRMQAAIQSQSSEDGFWIKLPCSMCLEERKLHPITEGFLKHEDAGRDS